MKNTINTALCACLAVLCTSCSSFLDPLPDGGYNQDNIGDYPNIIKGYVYQAYDLMPSSYTGTEFIGLDAATDDALYRSPTATVRQFSIGSGTVGSNPFNTWLSRDYKAIYYVNLFLKDDVGLNTRYLVDPQSDELMRHALQGDAYALRAWYAFDLLKIFGGRDVTGELKGMPIFTEPLELSEIDPSKIVRPNYEDCVAQILEDCDSALVYLPLANRDFAVDMNQNTTVLGGIRYGMFDQIAVKSLKALVLLTWASPAFNPRSEVSRYDEAARLCKEVIDYKTGLEATYSHFDPLAYFLWTDCNSPEIIMPSKISTTTTFETTFYPRGFGGSVTVVPSQDLVDAFPMANGYPITDSRSGYDATRPYVGRDPRFYADIYYNGSSVSPSAATGIYYTFDTTVGGADGPGLENTSPSGYYIRKYTNPRWNAFADTKESSQHSLHYFRWEQICLMFAEAANQVAGPLDSSTYGLSARDAIAWLRARKTQTGADGLGASGDPYLDECARRGAVTFDSLVRNEWRLVTCFEGKRYWNLRRWCKDVSSLNVPVHGARISGGTYDLDYVVETKSFPSQWQPINYIDLRKVEGLTQNAGWENWK